MHDCCLTISDNELNFTMIISNLSSDNLIALVLDLTQSLKINIAAVVAIPVLCIVLTTVVIIFALVAVIVVVRYEIHIMCTMLLIITHTLIAWLVIFKARWQSNARLDCSFAQKKTSPENVLLCGFVIIQAHVHNCTQCNKILLNPG